MTTLRIGVIGCANFAWRAMIPAIVQCEEVALVAVASRTEDKAQRFAEQFGCEAIVGYEELLSRDDIDAVYMPLPSGLHDEWVTKALKAKKHILVEKSCAVSAESAKTMVESAKENHLLILENYLFPLHSQHAWVTALVDRGELGELRLLRSTFGFPPLPEGNFRYNPGLGGGALLDAGGYVVKAARLFLGDDLKLLSATLRYDANRGVDIAGDAMFQAKGGKVAQVSFGFDYFYQCHYELLGTKGKLSVERAFTPPPDFQPRVVLEQDDRREEFVLDADNHYLKMIGYFAAQVRRPEGHESHGKDIVRQAVLLDDIRNWSEARG